MSITISVRTEEETVAELDKLAASLDRNRNWVVNDAITSYLELQRWQLEEIEKGIADSDAGRTVPHEEVKARIVKLEKQARSKARSSK